MSHPITASSPARPGALRGRPRRALLLTLALLGALALALQACETVPGPVEIKIGDPSPRADNSGTFSYPGFQSPSGRIVSVAASRDGHRVYAGTARGGLWRSDDGGASWQQLTAPQPGDNTRTCVDALPICGLPALAVADLVVAPDNPDLVVAAGAYDGRTKSLNGIYRSADGGKTWSRAFQFACGDSARSVTQLAVAPDDPKRLWAAGICGVAYSPAKDGDPVGATWTLVAMPDNGGVYHVAAGAAQGAARRVYACGDGGVYASTDGGRSFAKDAGASSALPQGACPRPRYADGVVGVDAAVLAAVPGHPEQIYLAAPSGSDGPAYFFDGHANGAACDPAALPCGGALWLGDYASATAGNPAGAWRKLPAPPVYNGARNGAGGAVSVRTQPAGDSYLVLFLDGDTLSVSAGPPSADGWHRLDGPDASALARAGATLGPDAARPAQPVHAGPRALAATPSFALTLAPGTAGDPAFAHDAELGGCGGGTLWLATDGGVYRTVDCGQTWQQSSNLETLAAYMLAGLPRPKSSNAYKLPAVYFGTRDNHDWYSMDGGLHWRGGDDACADCLGYWSDPVRGDLLVHPIPGEGFRVYTGPNGDAPDLYDNRQIAGVGFPATLGVLSSGGYTIPAAAPYFAAAVDPVAGWRPLIQTLPGQHAPPADLAMVAPAATPAAPPAAGTSAELAVWRKQTLDSGTDGWARDGAALPPGATILQAAGGHASPTYYVGDRAVASGGSLFDTGQQGDHLFRSHRDGSGALDGWDCIVPGLASAGAHDGRCASAGTSATRAYAFASDPYDANVVYILDADGVKLSTDGGAGWRRVGSLSDWLFEGGRLGAACVTFCGADPMAIHVLTGMEFVPDEPQMRFATGEAGAFFTNNAASANGAGEDWHRLLDSSGMGCLPRGTYFDKANTAGRALYVACVGRSLLSLVGIPRPGQKLDYTLDGGGQYPYPPLVAVGSPTTTPNATPTPALGYTLDFRVVPATDYAQSCKAGLKPLVFKLDNTRSGGPVTWRLALQDTDPAGAVWASASATGATIKGGEVGVLTLTPNAAVCGDMANGKVAVKTYTAVMTYTGGHQVVLGDTISVG